MKRKTLYMETTQIEPQKTAGEIISELVKAGASSVNTDYQDGRICGLRWIMRLCGGDVLFSMPVRTEPIFALINGRRSYPSSYRICDREQAERVAWRQLLRWVQAQLAMIDTGMVTTQEVFLPYIVVNADTNQTLFQKFEESRFKMITASRVWRDTDPQAGEPQA